MNKYDLIYIGYYHCSNGNLEVPVYFLKAKGGYTGRKIEKW
jgi:hypothetical protein